MVFSTSTPQRKPLSSSLKQSFSHDAESLTHLTEMFDYHATDAQLNQASFRSIMLEGLSYFFMTKEVDACTKGDIRANMAKKPIVLQSWEIVDDLFEYFDRDAKGHMTYEDWALAVSALERGSFDEKLQLLFYLTDKDNDGLIKATQVESFLQDARSLFFTIAGYVVRLECTNGASRPLPSEIVEHLDGLDQLAQSKKHIVHEACHQVFQILDTDKDGSITYQEFSRSRRVLPPMYHRLLSWMEAIGSPDMNKRYVAELPSPVKPEAVEAATKSIQDSKLFQSALRNSSHDVSLLLSPRSRGRLDRYLQKLCDVADKESETGVLSAEAFGSLLTLSGFTLSKAQLSVLKDAETNHEELGKGSMSTLINAEISGFTFSHEQLEKLIAKVNEVNGVGSALEYHEFIPLALDILGVNTDGDASSQDMSRLFSLIDLNEAPTFLDACGILDSIQPPTPEHGWVVIERNEAPPSHSKAAMEALNAPGSPFTPTRSRHIGTEDPSQSGTPPAMPLLTFSHLRSETPSNVATPSRDSYIHTRGPSYTPSLILSQVSPLPQTSARESPRGFDLNGYEVRAHVDYAIGRRPFQRVSSPSQQAVPGNSSPCPNISSPAQMIRNHMRGKKPSVSSPDPSDLRLKMFRNKRPGQ